VRGFLSGLTALLAILLLPVAMTAVWTAERVTDTDGYVAAVGPLADDPDVQETLIDRLEQYAAEVVGLERLGAARQQTASGVIRDAVAGVVASPSFRPVWEAVNRAGHEQVVQTLRDDAPGELTVLDLGPAVGPVSDALREQGLPVREVAAPQIVFVPDRQQLRAAQEGYQAIDAAGTWAPAAWVALVLITLLVARRRRIAVALLAVGSIVSAALLWPFLAGVRKAVIDSMPEADRDLAEAVWDAVTRSLERGVLVAVVIAVAALLVVVVLGMVRRDRPPHPTPEAS
jgi:hypothetical protein